MTKPRKAVSIKDVAKKANVSISTVSHVLNGTKPVSEPLRERVMDAIDSLHYEVNLVARGLKSGKTNTIAVIVSSVTSVFFPPLLASIQAEADRLGYSVSVYGTNGNLEREKEYIQNAKAQSIDGILLSSCVDTSSEKSKRYIDELSSLSRNGKPLPIVCLETTVGTELDAVVVDDELGLFTATSHLLSLGRKHVAYIAAPTSFSMGKKRKQGFISAMEHSHIAIPKGAILEGDYSPRSGYDCMKELLAKFPKLDAVAAGNDQMAIGAMRAIIDAGKKVPEDIAVIGYNDNFPASLITPSLSTIHVPKEDMGKSAMDLLMRRLENPDSPNMLIRLTGSLVVRNSTDPKATSTWDLENW